MKKIIAVLLMSLLLVSCATNVEPTITPEELNKVTKKINGSKLLLVDVYHNHCRTCQIIDPVVDELIVKYMSNKDVAIIKHDLSTPLTTANSYAVAESVGIADIYRSQKYSGIVLFINPKNKQVVETLIGEDSIESYDEAIKRNLESLS